MKKTTIGAILSLVALTLTGTSVIGASVSMHPVGSCYGGGVVFYVTSGGQHGLIAALSDAASPLAWDTTGLAVVTTQAQYFTGLANTTTILNTSTAGSFPAAAAASSYATAETCSTCTVWYLPAQEELSTLYSQANFSGASLWTNCAGTAPSAIYWSSTQVNGTPVGVIKVWTVDFTATGDAGKVVAPPNTMATEAVRAIRAF